MTGFCSIVGLFGLVPMETQAMECAVFKSPLSKLVAFFRTSRNKWKGKCQAAKQENKRLANQTRAVEKSREQWKQKARAAQERVRRLERELEEQKSGLARA